jgi:hypothetical protein
MIFPMFGGMNIMNIHWQASFAKKKGDTYVTLP